MFNLVSLEDELRIAPSDIMKDRREAITSVIEKTYVDKVIANVGLVVTVYDIQSIKGGMIHYSDGGAHFQVAFRLVVFRPFIGEILTGRIVKSSKRGVKVSIDFFDDIFVQHDQLQEPSFFNNGEGLWVWKFDGNEMYYQLQEEIRIRVLQVKFPPLPKPADLKESQPRLPSARHEQDPESFPAGTPENPYAPMIVYGTVAGDGLGPVKWWETAVEPGEDEGEGMDGAVEDKGRELDPDEADF